MTLVLDVTSLARWTGPAVGIARVEHALATAAATRPGTLRALRHPITRAFHRLRPEWADTVLGWAGALDVADPAQSLLSRHRLFTALERRRLARPRLDAPIARLQDALLGVRPHGHRLRDATGRRIAHLPPDMVLGEPIAFAPGDTILTAGSTWSASDLETIAALPAVRLVTLCYDLIPITHPQFFLPKDVAGFTRHWLRTLALADRVIVNAACIARDVGRVCAEHGLPAPETAVLPLGIDPPAARPAALLPPFRPGHVILFVSTIEPRKGHAILVEAWRRLLQAGIPQLHDMRLVFVGRPGWMVDDLLRTLADPPERLHHLPAVDDAGLAALLEAAAFAVYSSQYEGFGLPVIEALARGKPVLASSGGALPETVGGAYPTLDPLDPSAWADAMARWMAHPPPPPSVTPASWPEAAAAILDAAAAPGQPKTACAPRSASVSPRSSAR